VTQFKTFLQEEEAVQPLNALADYIPIEKIEHGVIYTRDHRYVKVVEVVPVNFLLRSAREQRSIIYSFISYLKIAPVKVQFKALTKRADINRHLDTVRRELEHEQDPRCRVLQEDYLKLIRQLGSREAITRRFFLVFEYEPLPGTKRGHEEEDAIASLQTAARTAANYLRQCGNEVISPENEDDATAEILYIVARTNALRAEHGIAALTADDQLMRAAQVRADEMAATGTYSHTRPDGRKYYTVTDCRQVGENIHQIPLLYLAQQKTALAETLVYSWSKSAGHMENMTDESYAAIGVGLARGTDANGLECWYCVQLFLRSGYSISAVDKPATK